MPSPEATFDAAAAALAGEGVRPGRRLDFVSRAIILRYKATHPEKSAHAIAAELGHDPRSVRGVLGYHESDVKAMTQSLMATVIPDRLDEWDSACATAALKGDHRPARDFLVAAGAIDPPAAASTNVNVGFQVVVAPRPGLPDYAVNELPAPVVTRVSAPASHVQAQAPSAMPDVRPTESDAQRTDAPASNVQAPDGTTQVVLTTTNTQRAPLTTHPTTMSPAHTSMRQRPRSRIRR